MNRFIVVVVLILICVAGLGYYLKWFRVESTGANGEKSITLTIDQKKIQADEKKALESVQPKR